MRLLTRSAASATALLVLILAAVPRPARAQIVGET